MPPIPFTPPTDNLYKFVALSGVAVMLFSLWLPTQYLDELEKMQDSTRVELQLLKLDEEHAQARLRLADAMAGSATMPTTTPFTKPAAADEDTRVERARLELRALLDKVEESARRRARVKVEVDRLDDRLATTRKMTVVCLMWHLGGLCFALGGFYKWYVKVQKPLDQILIAQLEKAEAERAVTKGSQSSVVKEPPPPAPQTPPDGMAPSEDSDA